MKAKHEDLVERCTALWMDPDPGRRREAIAAVWCEDAVHVLQQVRGHDERIATDYQFVE